MTEQNFYRIAPATSLVFREDGDTPTVEGMVVPYNEWSEVDSVLEGHFLERFAPASLKKTFAESFKRMKGYFEHGRSKMFDRAPIMDIQETWETDAGAFFRANLLSGLPDFMVDGLRKGLYGASLGARPIVVEREKKPQASDYNPAGLEERTYKELRAFDISLTPSPHYENATVMLRSITDELAVEALVKEPERLLQLLRETQEAEPPHSEPEEPEAPEAEAEPEPEPEPEPEGSRATPSVDYLSDSKEEAWQL
jgi:phage head maturation protease